MEQKRLGLKKVINNTEDLAGSLEGLSFFSKSFYAFTIVSGYFALENLVQGDYIPAVVSGIVSVSSALCSYHANPDNHPTDIRFLKERR
jgi:hypothetical protein